MGLTDESGLGALKATVFARFREEMRSNGLPAHGSLGSMRARLERHRRKDAKVAPEKKSAPQRGRGGGKRDKKEKKA